MLDNLADELAILEVTAELLGKRALLVVLLLGLGRQVDVDARALGGVYLGVQAVLGKIDGGTIDLVEHDSGKATQDLEAEVGTLDDIDGGDEVVDDEVGAWTVVDADGVGLADQTNSGVLALCDENGLCDGNLDFDGSVGVLEVLDDPLVAVEFLLGISFGCGLGNTLSADAVRFGLEFRTSATAAVDAILASFSVGDGRASA